MKIVRPKARYLDPSTQTPYQFIEQVGRICYKSEDRIGPGTDVAFIEDCLARRHMAVLEHAYIYAQCDPDYIDRLCWLPPRLLRFMHITDDLISGSFRAFHEWFDAMRNRTDYTDIEPLLVAITKAYPRVFGEQYDAFLDETRYMSHYASTRYPDTKILTRDEVLTIYKTYPDVLKEHIPHTVLFTTDRGVTHELVRHRPASFLQESTRYCNYAKGKFGSEITLIEPWFAHDKDVDGKHRRMYEIWYDACKHAETAYLAMLKAGAVAQEARQVLDHSTKTDIVVTANESEWQHIVNLRYLAKTGAPHPAMKQLMTLIVNELNERSDGRIEIN